MDHDTYIWNKNIGLTSIRPPSPVHPVNSEDNGMGPYRQLISCCDHKSARHDVYLVFSFHRYICILRLCFGGFIYRCLLNALS